MLQNIKNFTKDDWFQKLILDEKMYVDNEIVVKLMFTVKKF